jgi:hypothetical protein
VLRSCGRADSRWLDCDPTAFDIAVLRCRKEDLG